MNYIYIALILLIFIFLFKTLLLNRKFSPGKIKAAVSLTIIGLIIKYITEMVFMFCQSIRYLYTIKILYNLDLCLLPMAAIIAGYIFSRNSKIKFSIVIIIQCILMSMYVALMITNETIITMDSSYNYIVIFLKQLPVNIGYIVINGLILIGSVFRYSKKVSDRRGFVILMLGLFTSIAGVLDIKIRLAGACLIIYALCYSIHKFSRYYLPDNK